MILSLIRHASLRRQFSYINPPSLKLGLSSRNPMSTTATPPPSQHFIVYAPDKTEEGTFQHRLSVRPVHREKFNQDVEKGIIRVGGILLTPESVATPDAEKKMIGSMLIIKAKNIDEVRKIIEADIYYTAGVWDREKLVILPFQAATTIP